MILWASFMKCWVCFKRRTIFLYCKLRNWVALRGPKSKKNVTCESKVACKFSPDRFKTQKDFRFRIYVWKYGSFRKNSWIYKTKIYPWWENTEIIKIRSQCQIFRCGNYISFRLSRPQGGNLRSQGRMQFFKKIPQKALNRILTLANYSTGPGLLISSGIIDLQNNWFCE